MLNQFWILLGSDLGDRAEMLRRASSEIGSFCGRILGTSAMYESEPWGFASDTKFINQVIVIESALSPPELLLNTRIIEEKLDRIRSTGGGYQSRTIDIDILFCNQEIYMSDELVIPHPRLHLRKFTLVPLVEIDPTFFHPVLKKQISELLEICPDESVPSRIGEVRNN